MLLVVTGMQREAKLLRGRCETVVAGSDNSTLTSKIEAAVTRGARAILSFGICGALSPKIAIGSVIVGTYVVAGSDRCAADEAWASALARTCNATTGLVAGTDSVLLTQMAKAELQQRTGAISADMESHIVAQAATERGLPFAVLRAVSDDAQHTLPPAAAFGLNTEGAVDYSAVILSLLDEPSQFRALIRTARDTDTAMKALKNCIRCLGPGLACPYLTFP